MKRLDDALKEKNDKILKSTIKLSKDKDAEWVDILLDEKSKNHFYGDGKSIMSKINIIDLIISLDESDAHQVHSFNINILRGIYNFRNLKEIYYNDLDPLLNLLSGVDIIIKSKPKEDNYIYLYSLNQTKSILEEIIERLK